MPGDPKVNRRDAEEEHELEEGEFTDVHQLENKWTLYFDNPGQKQNVNQFGQSLRPVFTFSTVEDFWRLFNNIKPPSAFATPPVTYYLFKEHVQPKWEDPNNKQGGSWIASVPKGGSNAKQMIDDWWLNTCLTLIGEQFDEGEEVHGAGVNIRKNGDRIELWTKTSSNESAQLNIAKQLRHFLDIPERILLSYSVFADKLSGGGRGGKDRYTG